MERAYPFRMMIELHCKSAGLDWRQLLDKAWSGICMLWYSSWVACTFRVRLMYASPSWWWLFWVELFTVWDWNSESWNDPQS
jgi:hypothetical protein